MGDINELFGRWKLIEEAMDGFDPYALLPLLCMAIDYVAVKNSKGSAELLNELRPFIEQVNADMGAMAV